MARSPGVQVSPAIRVSIHGGTLGASRRPLLCLSEALGQCVALCAGFVFVQQFDRTRQLTCGSDAISPLRLRTTRLVKPRAAPCWVQLAWMTRRQLSLEPAYVPTVPLEWGHWRGFHWRLRPSGEAGDNRKVRMKRTDFADCHSRLIRHGAQPPTDGVNISAVSVETHRFFPRPIRGEFSAPPQAV
jgi:hypothetical protein